MQPEKNTYQFSAKLDIIGINPFVLIPDIILKNLLADANKTKGNIPVCGKVNDKPYKQTLLRYKGDWRLYINSKMLKYSPKRIGEVIFIEIAVDMEDRSIEMNPAFYNELLKNEKALQIFNNLTPSLQKEIVRYLNSIKREETLQKNIRLAIGFLVGENKFIGRAPLIN